MTRVRRSGARSRASCVVLLGSLSVAMMVSDARVASASSSPAPPSFAGSGKTVGAGGFDIATGDVNGDGNLDLATTNQTPDTVSVLLGHGDGTFADHVD